MTGASGGGNGSGGTSSNCPTGSERCACYGNNTCDQGLECRSNLCVTGASGGSIGTGGTSSSGGASTGGNTSSAVGTGGATTGGTDPTSTGCAQQYVPIQVLPPDIMIILDRSMSMTNDVNGQICTGGNPAGDGMCGTEAKWYKSIVAIDAVVQAT